VGYCAQLGAAHAGCLVGTVMSVPNFGCPAWQLSELGGVLEGAEDRAGAYPWEKGVRVPFMCMQGLAPESCSPGLGSPSQLPPWLPRQLILAFLSLTV